MSLTQGRVGFLGLGIEVTAGTPVAATTLIPFVSNTIKGRQTPIKDISARGNRIVNSNSVLGKRWGEGEVEVNVDLTQIGFLLALAAGNENVSTLSAGVGQHVFFSTVSGSIPKTATLYNYQGIDTQRFASMAVDTFELDVKDDLFTAKTAFKGFHPTSGSYAPVSVSGTLITFGSYNAKFGTTLTTASQATALPLTNFNFKINNNVETIFESPVSSGGTNTSRVFNKGLEVTGEFTRYFESLAERDAYYNLTKSAVIITVSGNGIGGGNAEALTLNLERVTYSDTDIDTGLDNFFGIKTSWFAEPDDNQGKLLYDAILVNQRTTVYA